MAACAIISRMNILTAKPLYSLSAPLSHRSCLGGASVVPVLTGFGSRTETLDADFMPKPQPNHGKTAGVFAGLTVAYIGLCALSGKLAPGWDLDINSVIKGLVLLGGSGSGGVSAHFIQKHRQAKKAKKQKVSAK